MLRFCGKNLVSQKEKFTVTVIGEIHMSDEGIWRRGMECFRRGRHQNAAVLQMVSMLDVQKRTLCYGWQDVEANRELRMLRELEETQDVILFGDIFPNIKEVIVCGCNELAYHFVKYLEHCNIPVSVIGKYWEYMGYQCIDDMDSAADKMVIMAEPGWNGNMDLFQRVVRSASPEFECIDQIYEANVLAGKIKDTWGRAEWFFAQMRGKKVVIVGTDERAQDAYDLLYQNGIDIWCFAEGKRGGSVKHIPKILLDRHVLTVWEVMNSDEDVVFIDVYGEKSALGTSDIDFFDYHGYRRNRQFFMLNDYVDIMRSNLVHVLKGKNIFLAGDGILCSILAQYLEKIEQGNITIRYIDISQWIPSEHDNQILFIVHPWCGSVDAGSAPELWNFRKQLNRIKDISYSEYFSHAGAFAIIDAYMNNHWEKYTHEQIIPKGILLGAIPSVSGNVLVRGILDGHPNIMQILYDDYDLNNNLFWYCICLSWDKNKGLEGKPNETDTFLPNYGCFKENIKKTQIIDSNLTSQEIFLAYHIAYMDRKKYRQVEDMSQLVIYWEPHNFPRTEIPFLAQWLESERIKGRIFTTRRNNLVWFGSIYKWNRRASDVNRNYWVLNCMLGVASVCCEALLKYWKEYVVRFEDIKLHPRAELLKFCDEVGIPWAETLMHTTNGGNKWIYEESITDFDIKPVFNPYVEFLSEFDRFRLSIISAPYQKKYGYIYEDCLKFSRKELQEMFLKEFRFQNKLQFETDTERTIYYLFVYDFLGNALWKVRKHAVLDDIVPEFDAIEIGRIAGEEQE